MSVIIRSNSLDGGIASGVTLVNGVSGNTGGTAGSYFNAVFSSAGNSITYFPGFHGMGVRFLAAGGGSASLGYDDTAGMGVQLYTRSYMNFKKFHTANMTLINARGAEGGSTGYALRITPAGILQFVQASGTVVLAQAPVALNLNTWYRVETFMSAVGAWGLRVLVGDTFTPAFPEASGTGAVSGMTGTVGFTFLRWGADGTAVQAEVLMDDLAYGSNWIGPVMGSLQAGVSITSADSGWTAVGSTSIIEALGDEDAATFAQSPGLTAAYQPIKIRLGEVGIGDITVRARLGGDSLPDARVRLMQGNQVIATWTATNLAATGADYSWALTTAQANSITDRTDLHVEIAGIL